MQKIYGYMRKAVQEFDLIQPGDRIAVGISGGKDSIALLMGLIGLQRFLESPFTIHAVTLDPCFGGIEGDYSEIEALCKAHQVPYTVIRTRIAEVVFDIRKEKCPCSLCAKLRRGALHEATRDLGCNKIALGHHYNDAVETFMMNLFTEGRIGCFAPKSYLSRRDITLIRPLCLTPEKEIRRTVERLKLPVLTSRCPVDGHTGREDMKEFLAQREREDKGFTKRIFGAMRRANVDDWGGVHWVSQAKFHGRPEEQPDARQDSPVHSA